MKGIQSKKILSLKEQLNKEIEKEEKKQSKFKTQGFDLLVEMLNSNENAKKQFLEFMKANKKTKNSKTFDFIQNHLG